jgi:hypothetical protein
VRYGQLHGCFRALVCVESGQWRRFPKGARLRLRDARWQSPLESMSQGRH